MQTVLGIDLGGTKLKGAVITSQGQVLAELTIPSNAQQGRAAVLAQINELVRTLGKTAQCEAIGIGTPGFVNADTGTVVFASDNLPGWSGTHLKAELAMMTHLPIVVGNDAKLAALGEAWLGAGRNLKSFMMITLGTGVGGAFFALSSGLLQGANWRAGEVGHSLLYPGGRPCSCGQKGCVDQYLAGPALEAEYERITGAGVAAAEIIRLFCVGDKVAESVVRSWCRDLASLFVSLQSVLDPAAFVLGGGVAGSFGHWGQLLQEHLSDAGPLAGQVTVRVASLGNQAGCYGAARLSLDLLGQEICK